VRSTGEKALHCPLAMDSGIVREDSPMFFQILDQALARLSSPRVNAKSFKEPAERAELMEKAIALQMARAPAYQQDQQANHCEVSEAFVDDCRKLGFIEAVLPSSNKYCYAMIDGNTLPIMTLSANYLAHLCCDHHVSVDQIIMLASKRKAATKGCGNDGAHQWELPIDTSKFQHAMFHPDIQPKVEENLGVEADTEYSLACQLREELAAKGPERMKDLWSKAEVVCADDEKANTIATLQNWLVQKPVPGSVLYLSIQPFLMGRRTGLRKWLAHSAFQDQKLDVVGPGLTSQVQSKEFGAVLLDRIGAWAHVTIYDPEYMPPRHEMSNLEANSWNASESESETESSSNCGESEVSAELKQITIEEFVSSHECKHAGLEFIQKLLSSAGSNSEV